MTIIIYGANNDVFETYSVSIPDAITELYAYCGGRMGRDLFSRIIEGLVITGTIQDMVDAFDHHSCEQPIHKIYAGANRYFTSEDLEDGNCKKRPKNVEWGMCHVLCEQTHKDDFCSYGERKDNEVQG